MTAWNNYCARCRRYVFSRRVKKGTPCPRCGQPCVEYGDMKREQLAHVSRELQKLREQNLREVSTQTVVRIKPRSTGNKIN
jgi:transcription initiation factor IIE alpha subunit